MKAGRPARFDYEYQRNVSDDAIETMIACFAECPTPMGQLLLEHVHGAAARVSISDTAFPHRSEGYNFLILCEWINEADNDRCIAWTRKTFGQMQPFFATGRYVNYLGDDEAGEPVAAAYGPNYRGLQKIKAKYDPENFFRMNQNIRGQIAELRAYVRQRERLLEYAASHIQHMQKALTEMNLQLHHVVADITGSTGLRIIRAILAGERDPEALACLRHYSCHSSAETIAKALTGSYRTEHLFALEQALALYDAYHEKASACDVRIEAVLKELSIHRGRDVGPVPPASRRRHRTDQANALAFDARAALFALLGKDITRIDGLGPYLSLKLIAECGDDLSSWPSAKHFTSWLGLAPSNKISGGKMLSSRTRRSGGRAAALLRLAAVTVGRTDTALGAFYRRLSSRIGKAKAVTATARKVAVLFYNAVRHGMQYVDPGASSYETRYRTRVVNNLHRRAKAFGFVLQPLEPKADAVVS